MAKGVVKPYEYSAQPDSNQNHSEIAQRMISEQLLCPLGDRVLVLIEPQEISSIIILIRSENFDHRVGTVISVGRGRTSRKGTLISNTLTPGTRIVFPHHAGAYVRIDNQPCAVISEETVLGVIDNHDE